MVSVQSHENAVIVLILSKSFVRSVIKDLDCKNEFSKEFGFLECHFYITLKMTNEDLKNINNVWEMQSIFWLHSHN